MMVTCTDMQVLWKCCGLHSALVYLLHLYIVSVKVQQKVLICLWLVQEVRCEMRCPTLAHSIHPHTYSPFAATAARKKTQTTFVVVAL